MFKDETIISPGFRAAMEKAKMPTNSKGGYRIGIPLFNQYVLKLKEEDKKKTP